MYEFVFRMNVIIQDTFIILKANFLCVAYNLLSPVKHSDVYVN